MVLIEKPARARKQESGMATAARRRRSRRSTSFGRILRSELEAQGVSIRELARRLARSDEKVENERRLLHLYVSGEVSPGTEKRERIADALAIDPSTFAEDAERQAEREQLVAALEPLVDTLLDLATKARG